MLPAHRLRARSEKAFSLVEITLAIGITSFAFIAVLGLVPTGLRTAEAGYEQGRAMEVLSTATAAVLGQRYIGTVSGNRNYAFGDWLSDAEIPQSCATKYYVGQSPWSYGDYAVTEAGMIRKKGAVQPPERYKLFIRVTPGTDNFQPVQVYVSVAWPGTSVWDTPTGQWKNNQGHVETTVYANPPSS